MDWLWVAVVFLCLTITHYDTRRNNNGNNNDYYGDNSRDVCGDMEAWETQCCADVGCVGIDG